MKLLIWLWVMSMVASIASAEEGKEQRVFGKSDVESFADKVVVIKIGRESLVNSYSFKYWRKVLKRADEEKARAVVFDIDTPGGYAMETAELIVRVLPELKVPTIAYVNPEATSAGSLVAFGCDRIYMHPRGSIGSTGLVSSMGDIEDTMRAKLEALFRTYVKIVAKEKGRNPDLMYAMMFKDEYYSFADGKVEVKEGELLNLTADEAVLKHLGKPLLADGICDDLEAVLAAEKLTDAEVIKAEPTGFEAFASWVAMMSPLLIAVGLVGAFLEMKTPGFGIFGVISLIAFGTFFFGNHVAGNLAGYELAVLFSVGLLLLVLEVLVIPGTFVAGGIGLLMMLAALVVAMVDEGMMDSFMDDSDASVINVVTLVGLPVIYLALGVLGAGGLAALLLRFLPTLPMYHSLAVDEELKPGTSIAGMERNLQRVGQSGVALTQLRPGGRAEFDGEVLEVHSAGGFVEAGTAVKIVSVDGMRILVDVAV